MGVVRCEIHGRSGLRPVCYHLVANCKNKVKPERVITSAYYFGNIAGEADCPIIMSYSYCLDCANNHNLPLEDAVWPEDEFDKAPSEIFNAVCGKCFSEVIGPSWKLAWESLMKTVDALSQQS
jgi:hypothetical protein